MDRGAAKEKAELLQKQYSDVKQFYEGFNNSLLGKCM